MKAITAAFLAGTTLTAFLAAGCCNQPQTGAAQPDLPAAKVVIASPEGIQRPPFRFSAEDAAFLDQVQRGAWNWAMDAGNKVSGMVPDRDSQPYISIAGVGFQLASFPVAVEHGWITKDQARERVDRILTILSGVKTTRKYGMYQHFVDGETAELPKGAYEDVVSTIDSGLLMCGCLVVSSYFGGETAAKADAIVAAADWAAFLNAGHPKDFERGYISLGWKPKDIRNDPVGAGEFMSYYWLDAGCEHRLVTFLAVAAPDAAHRVGPEVYYRLRRQIGKDEAKGVGQLVYFPWSGALFTNQFSHLFIDYAAMDADAPGSFGQHDRARVDWWENARRTTNLHRARAAAYGKKHPGSGFGENAWGLTASDCSTGYQVSGVFPKLDEEAMTGSRLMYDYSWYRPDDNYGDGSIAPYGAGMSVMFEPAASVAALRNYKSIADSTPALAALWQDPATGGHGLADAYNPQKKWVGKDHLAIDQLPMLLAIENARTGLVWRLFHQHPFVQAGMKRLDLKLNR